MPFLPEKNKIIKNGVIFWVLLGDNPIFILHSRTCSFGKDFSFYPAIRIIKSYFIRRKLDFLVACSRKRSDPGVAWLKCRYPDQRDMA